MKQVRVTPISTATPTAETTGATGSAGSSGSASDGAHRHAMPSAAQVLSDIGIVSMALAADLVKTASTVLANVTGWAFAIGANETWDFDLMCIVTQTTNGGAQFDVTGPAAAALVEVSSTVQYAPTAFGSAFVEALSTPWSHAPGAVGDMVIRIRGRIVNGANAGTVQVRFAQSGASGVSTLLANSGGKATKG